MIDKNSIDIYKSITASDSLKERISHIQPDKKSVRYSNLFRFRTYRVFAYALAMLVLVLISTAAFSDLRGVNVYVDGVKVGSTPVEVSSMNALQKDSKVRTISMPIVSIDMMIKTDGKTEITISSGKLIRDNNEVEGYAKILVSDNELIQWEIDGIVDTDLPRMTIRENNKEKVYQLEYNKENNSWAIRLW